MNNSRNLHEKKFPPGRIKIVKALSKLLETQRFNDITTSEIAKTAGVTEALIYKYFKDKRDLLHEVLREYLEDYVFQMKQKTKNIKNWKERLYTLLKLHFHLYSINRVLPKILLLEVRNSHSFYENPTYAVVQEYSDDILEIIEEGIRCGDIRDNISTKAMRQFILGGFEHFILPKIIFNLKIDEDTLTQDLCELVFHGILKD